MRIGVTERGDPSCDMSWVEKMDTVDGAVIITKNITLALMDNFLKYKDKIILHITDTGMAGTPYEPSFADFRYQINMAKQLINKGFDPSHMVLRIDPIIPTQDGLTRAQNVINYLIDQEVPIKRIRISIIDMYPHVRARFKNADLPLPYGDYGFSPLPVQVSLVDNWVKHNKELYPQLEFEACAEKNLLSCIQIGCISNKDLSILGLPLQRDDYVGFQRKGCSCLSGKVELLSERKRCPLGCQYCYWRD